MPQYTHRIATALHEALWAVVRTRDTQLRAMEMESAVLFGRILESLDSASNTQREAGRRAALLHNLPPDDRLMEAHAVLALLLGRLALSEAAHIE